MGDKLFTLIDVETGMYRISLHTILTPPCFVFFWGLVQTANLLKPRFKNPFSLTVAQAIAAGGGNSRQAVNRKQQQLNAALIDGACLIEITSGSRALNVSAKYKISYDLLVPINSRPSQICDEQRTNRGRSSAEPSQICDEHRSILRSEVGRGEENHPTNPNNLTTEDYLFQKLPPSRMLKIGWMINHLGIEVIEEEIKLAEDEQILRASTDDPIRSFGAYLYTRLENKCKEAENGQN